MMMPDVSMQRMAAGRGRLQMRAFAGRRHRSPSRSAGFATPERIQ